MFNAKYKRGDIVQVINPLMPEFEEGCVFEVMGATNIENESIYALKKTGENKLYHSIDRFKWIGVAFMTTDRDNNEVKEDVVNNPKHYTSGKYETIDMIESITGDNFKGFLVGNIIKYVSRYEYKNGIIDLEKSEWYLKKLISTLRGDK